MTSQSPRPRSGSPRPDSPKQLPLATAAPRRIRRSSAEVQELILSSARELFGKWGYGQTSTRAIAEHAGVLEHLIFRRFGSKALLFEQAVFVPFGEKLEAFFETFYSHRRPGVEGTTERARYYLEMLYSQLSADRQLWSALVLAVQTDDGELAHLLQSGESPLVMYLERLSELTQTSMDEMGWKVDAAIATRLTFGFVFALALFGDLLFRPGKRPSRKALLDEMTTFMVHGLAHRPAASGRADEGEATARPRARRSPAARDAAVRPKTAGVRGRPLKG